VAVGNNIRVKQHLQSIFCQDTKTCVMRRLLLLLCLAILVLSCGRFDSNPHADCSAESASRKITEQSSIIVVGALISGAYLAEKASIDSRLFPCSVADETGSDEK
jgi:hypothetical protein